MNDRNFHEMLEAQWAKGNFVCVGLDSDYNHVEEITRQCRYFGGVRSCLTWFNKEIVRATRDLVCAYEPNIAFYEACGTEGLDALRETIADIHRLAPDVPVILDAAFKYLQADAITVSPYLGAEALEPFLKQADKGMIVLCRTSNPGAGEFQDKIITPSPQEAQRWNIIQDSSDRMPEPYWEIKKLPLYQYVAYRVSREWNKNNNCALVVSATYPKELREVRNIVGDMPILMPGIGFQQKDISFEEQVKMAVNTGKDSRGQGIIINSSLDIIFASEGADFAEAAHYKTEKLRNLINQSLS